MADLSRYPSDDVVRALDIAGHTVYEAESPAFGEGLLDSIMRDYYAGTLTRVAPVGAPMVDAPSQVGTFLQGAYSDIIGTLEGAAEATRNVAGGFVSATRYAKYLPLALAVAGGVMLYIYARKA